MFMWDRFFLSMVHIKIFIHHHSKHRSFIKSSYSVFSFDYPDLASHIVFWFKSFLIKFEWKLFDWISKSFHWIWIVYILYLMMCEWSYFLMNIMFVLQMPLETVCTQANCAACFTSLGLIFIGFRCFFRSLSCASHRLKQRIHLSVM